MRPLLSAALGLALALLTFVPATAQVTGISYTAAPTGVRVFSGGSTGLSDGTLLGGALGLGFGEYLEVSGVYLRGNAFETEFSGLDTDPATLAVLEAQAEGFDVDVEQIGTRLRLTVGRGSLLPFVVGGTGVLRLDNGAYETEAIFAEAGAGVTFAFQDRYTVTVEGTRFGYRYNPYAAFDLGNTAGLPSTSSLNDVRRAFSTTVVATARIRLGGRTRGSLSATDLAVRDQLRRPRLYAQPTYGVLRFSDDLVGLPDQQPMLGVQAGVDFGPYVGLRGFYYRATAENELFDDPTTTRDLSLFGAEIDFRFSTELAGGVTPFLLLGGGYMDVGSDYRAGGALFSAPEGRYFAMGGGGVDVALTRALRLKAGVRALLMSNEDADQVADPASVYTSLLPTAGLEFSLGGGDPRDARRRALEAEARERAAQDGAAVLVAEQSVTLGEAPADSLLLARERAAREALLMAEAGQRLTPEQAAALAAYQADLTAIRAGDISPMRSNVSDRTMEIPIPENGEVYIRFGAGTPDAAQAPVVVATPQGYAVAGNAGVPTGEAPVSTAEDVAAVVRQTLAADSAREALQRVEDVEALADGQEEANDELRARLEARIAELETRLAAQIAAGNAAPRGPNTVVVSDADGDGGFSLTRVGTRRLSNVYPVFGVRSGEDRTQGQFAIRGEYRTPTRTGAVFVPEVGVGFADGVSLSLLANFFFQTERNAGRGLQPYYGLGGGLLTRSGLTGTGLAFNLTFGADYPLGPGAIVGEVSTLDFFQYTRVLTGYKLSF